MMNDPNKHKCKLRTLIPGGGLGIFTDRDQQSICWVLNFENFYFFGYGHSCCIFLGCQINVVFLSVLCIQQYFLGLVSFEGTSENAYRSSLLSSCTQLLLT